MKLHLHIGAHFAELNDVRASAMANHIAVDQTNVYLPRARHVRLNVRKALESLGGLPPVEEEQKKLFDFIVPRNIQDGFEQACFIEESWIGGMSDLFSGNRLYETAPERLQSILELFSDHELSLSLAIRNPAVMMHLARDINKTRQPVEDFAARVPIADISWFNTIQSLREVAPDLPLTVWCQEDQLLLWPQIFRVLGLEAHDYSARGTMVPFEKALLAEGLPRFQAYLKKHPPKNDTQFERILMVFLEKYANEEIFDAVVDIPGWGSEEIEDVSALYDADITALADLEGVTVLLPSEGDEPL